MLRRWFLEVKLNYGVVILVAMYVMGVLIDVIGVCVSKNIIGFFENLRESSEIVLIYDMFWFGFVSKYPEN